MSFSFRVVTRVSGETLRERWKTEFSPLPTGLPRAPFPSPFPFSLNLAYLPLREILAEAVVIGFSSVIIRIARHLIECTLTLAGAHFGGALRGAQGWGLDFDGLSLYLRRGEKMGCFVGSPFVIDKSLLSDKSRIINRGEQRIYRRHDYIRVNACAPACACRR